MSLFKKLRKVAKIASKAASLYGKVGGLVGAPGAGIAAKFGTIGTRMLQQRGQPKVGMGHNARTLARAQGVGHQRMTAMHQRARALTVRRLATFGMRRGRRPRRFMRPRFRYGMG